VIDPDLAFENIRTTYNMLEYCRTHGVKRIIYASSREVYGNVTGTYRSEDQVNISHCEGPYTASKISGEALVHAYSRCYGIDGIIMRFSNVYGMYDNSDRVVPLFIRLAREDRDLIIYGRDKVLDFTYIDDTVAGILERMQQFQRVKNNVFNISAGEGVLMADVAHKIVELMGSRSRVVMKDNRVGEVVRFAADISKAKQLVGYRPTVFIEDGLRKSVAWYARHVTVASSGRPVLDSARTEGSRCAPAPLRGSVTKLAL